MPTPQYFRQCPEFPPDIPVASIPVLSLERLQSHDHTESEKLYEACQVHGFFLLDLRDAEGGMHLLRDAEKMFDLITETLNLDQATLDRYAYDPPRSLIGYVAS